jgi:flavin reductase (DIM6/NTAB) family NADH-FMN oxidoreductase RutF
MPSIDPRIFRQTIGQFPTGVSVVAAEADGIVHGMTANALTSLSLKPLLMLVCVDKRAKMVEFLERAAGFSINILREDQQALSTYFAGSWKEERPPAFRFVPWEGAPRLEGCAAAVACRSLQRVEGGDHWIVIGEVVALHLGVEPRHPLVFHSGNYRRLDHREIKPAPELSENKMDISVFYDPWKEE